MHILLKLAERLREVDQSFKILQMPPTSMLDRMIFTTSSAGGASWENWTKQVSKLPLWYPGIRCRLVAAWPKRASTQSLQKAAGSLCKPPKKKTWATQNRGWPTHSSCWNINMVPAFFFNCFLQSSGASLVNSRHSGVYRSLLFQFEMVWRLQDMHHPWKSNMEEIKRQEQRGWEAPGVEWSSPGRGPLVSPKRALGALMTWCASKVCHRSPKTKKSNKSEKKSQIGKTLLFHLWLFLAYFGSTRYIYIYISL